MANDSNVLRFQAEHHPIEGELRFETIELYCLYLMHLRAYEQVSVLARGKTVLDLGCNNGWGTAVIGKAARRVVGADVSNIALEHANRSITSDNVEFRRIDGERLPFSDGEFEIVVSCQV